MQDITDFKHFLRADPAAAEFLKEQAAGPATLARAPGRLDVMGGVADYSGSLVAEMTIAEAACVALTPRTDRTLRVWSLGLDSEFASQVSLSLNDFYSPDSGTLLSYDAVRLHLGRDPKTRWAAYLFGCVYVLLAEGIVQDFPHGANLILDSRVPLGAGVSSSAAIEVAAMQAVNAAYRLGLDGVTLARLCQSVENKVVGAPCGIMDQMSSALCVPNSLLLIVCQPHEVQGTQALPDGVRVFGINSAVKHSVGGSAYTRARVAAFMGRKILSLDYSRRSGVDYGVSYSESLILGYNNNYGSAHEVDYLAYLSSGEFSAMQPLLPEAVSGFAYLAAHGETGDDVTTIDPYLTYFVRASTAHGIFENRRVKYFVSYLERSARTLPPEQAEELIRRAGGLMYESHTSYSQIGLGCEETDRLVNLGCAAGSAKGICGARITGGGSGGTVAFLTYGERAAQTIHEIAEAYQEQTGLTPQIFEGGLSPGAMAFGSETL